MIFSLFILLTFVVLLFICTFVLIRFFLVVTTVQGESMSPTLLPNDRLLVLRHWPSTWLRKGQIVVGDLRRVLDISDNTDINFTLSISEYNRMPSEKFVKRLVGLPGDVVSIHISELHEKLQVTLQSKSDANGVLVWHIPPGHCFVQGDGLISSDSITWGPIPIKLLTGLVLLKLPSKSHPKEISGN